MIYSVTVYLLGGIYLKLPTISLCMIVKNEEQCLFRCLDSVKVLVDEIIIVDTGSIDRTVEICELFDANVVHYTWNDNFAEARNYGLQYATGDWILWMDADEEMERLDTKQIKQLLSLEEEHLLWIELINYNGDEAQENDAFHIEHSRFFRNHLGLRFNNAIHEILNVEEVLPEWDNSHRRLLPIKIYHHGYMNEYVVNKKKSERNITLLEKELLKEDHSPWIKYHIAIEHYRLQNYEISFDYVNRSIVHFLKDMIPPPSLLYKLKYSILISLGSLDAASKGIERAIMLYPDYVDLHFYKGIIYYMKGWYSQAIEVLEHCLQLGETNMKHLTLKGVGSFHAWYYIGQCQEKLEDVKQAMAAYTTAIQSYPNYKSAHEALEKLTCNLIE